MKTIAGVGRGSAKGEACGGPDCEGADRFSETEGDPLLEGSQGTGQGAPSGAGTWKTKNMRISRTTTTPTIPRGPACVIVGSAILPVGNKHGAEE